MDINRLEPAAGTEAVLIAGPTASGKSRLAVELAHRHGGVVVNADSMQVYAELRVLSARPDVMDEASAPHRLYGHVPAATRYSVGRWLQHVEPVLDEAKAEGRLAIIVGGTGLYFKALTEGLASVPPIPPELREALLARSEGEPSEALHRQLAEVDPEDSARIRPSDRSRILRALEVFEATGRPLEAWRQGATRPALSDMKVERYVIDPDRAFLHHLIAGRAEMMLNHGGVEEARALAALGLSPDLPAMKAIGVREIASHLRGDMSLEETLAAMCTETRRYAKRQMTWFRNQMKDWRRLPLKEA